MPKADTCTQILFLRRRALREPGFECVYVPFCLKNQLRPFVGFVLLPPGDVLYASLSVRKHLAGRVKNGNAK